MLLRALLWLLTVGACVAVLSFDGAPADPVLSRDAAPTPTAASLLAFSPMAVVSHALAPRPRGFSVAGYPGRHGLPPELALCRATVDEAAAYAELLRALAQAEDRALEAPVVWPEGFRVALDYDQPARKSVGVYPAWDLQGLLTGLDRAGQSEIHWGAAQRLEWTDGGVLAVGSHEELANLTALWPLYRQRMGCVGVPVTPPPSSAAGLVDIFPTYALNHLGSLTRNTNVVVCVLEPDRNAKRIPGGLIGRGPAADHAALRQTLDDPHWIRLAAALDSGPVRRLSELRAALHDDDPQRATFAMFELQYEGRRGIRSLPPEILLAYPHRAAAGSLVEEHFSDELVRSVLIEAPREVGAHQLMLLGRTAVNADRLSGVVGPLLFSPSRELRAAAQAVLFERLPRGAISIARASAPPPVDLPAREWTQFVNELVGRLRQELAQGDAERAADAAGEALGLCQDALRQGASPWTVSRLVELGAELAFDPALGKRFRARLHRTDVLAIEECLRRSDPEIRGAAFRILAEWQPANRVLWTYGGDPYPKVPPVDESAGP